MADNYAQLTDGEKCYWNIYTRLRELSDWPAFTDGQNDAKTEARAWLVDRRKEIWRSAQPEADGGDGKGWDHASRRQRYAQLADDSLNSGSPRDLCQLPTGGGTDTEKVKISEREMWWNQSSVDEATQAWRENCTGWLIDRRKKVWHLGEDDGWNTSNRQSRYDALCVATRYGNTYDKWLEDHNATTGADKPDPVTESSREKVVELCRSYLGVNEDPAGSNRGHKIDEWNQRCAGYLGAPWCASFASCMAWDSGVAGSSSAAVQYIVSMSKSGQGMFKGWTTNPADVLRGDFAIISCTTCHVEVCVDNDDAYHTIGGNTSPGDEGSQYDGGCVAERHRKGEVVGWARVDYP